MVRCPQTIWYILSRILFVLRSCHVSFLPCSHHNRHFASILRLVSAPSRRLCGFRLCPGALCVVSKDSSPDISLSECEVIPCVRVVKSERLFSRFRALFPDSDPRWFCRDYAIIPFSCCLPLLRIMLMITGFAIINDTLMLHVCIMPLQTNRKLQHCCTEGIFYVISVNYLGDLRWLIKSQYYVWNSILLKGIFPLIFS